MPDDLLGSEILDYTIDNYTNTILYSIKKDNYYFFYINNKSYENKYQNQFKYFSSPLIKKDEEYYFCSSLKNIIKLNSKGELEEIQNLPKITINYDDYELKCFYHPNEKIIIVAFINTFYVISYNLNEFKWIFDENQDYRYNFGNNILDVNVFNIENYDSSYGLGVLLQKENYYPLIFCESFIIRKETLSLIKRWRNVF